MNTPEPFSQARDRNRGQQPFYPSGQPQRNNTPLPSNTGFSPQVGQNQGYPSQQNASWPPPASTTGAFPPRTAPTTPSTPGMIGFPQSQTTPWDRPGGNQWSNGTNGSGGFMPPNTPIPPNNTSSLTAKPPRRPDTTKVGKILLFLGLALLVVTAGITGIYLFNGSASTLSDTTQAHTKPTVRPTPTPTPTVHMQHQQIATQYVATMSLNDEIAQLLMVEHDDATYSSDLDVMVNQQHVGAVIYEGPDAIVSTTQIKSNISNMQQRAKIPVFTAIDEEGWNVGRMRALYPNYRTYRMDAQAIGLSGDPNVAAQQGQQTAKDMLSIGMNMNLAPDVDVAADGTYIDYDRRSFGATSDAVIKYAGPYLKALQTNGIVGTIKHFPGLGTDPKGIDPHAVLPVYPGTKADLYKTDLVPFQHFIQDTDPYEQARVVMPTDMLVKAIDPIYPAELSHTFITDILRNQMGFQGVILSDSLHMGGVLVDGQAPTLADACVLALEAGNDMLEGALTSTEVQAIIDAINAVVQSGKVTKAQIDASVVRVLTLKMDFNVMPATLPKN